MQCSYCRITGHSRNLPKPNYPPLSLIKKDVDAQDKRTKFCKITSRSMDEHHYVPQMPSAGNPLMQRRSSGCRVMQKSHSMEIHHYIPSFEDISTSQVNACKITQNNRSMKDYRYVYPVVAATEARSDLEMQEIQFSLSYVHHFMDGYQYVAPSTEFGSHDEMASLLRTKLNGAFSSGRGSSVSSVGSDDSTNGHHRVSRGFKYVYSVEDELCSVIVPDEIEEVLRASAVDNIWLTPDHSEIVIVGSCGEMVHLPTKLLTSEEVHEELEDKNLMPGLAGGGNVNDNAGNQHGKRLSHRRKSLRQEATLEGIEMINRRKISENGDFISDVDGSTSTASSCELEEGGKQGGLIIPEGANNCKRCPTDELPNPEMTVAVRSFHSEQFNSRGTMMRKLSQDSRISLKAAFSVEGEQKVEAILGQQDLMGIPEGTNGFVINPSKEIVAQSTVNCFSAMDSNALCSDLETGIIEVNSVQHLWKEGLVGMENSNEALDGDATRKEGKSSFKNGNHEGGRQEMDTVVAPPDDGVNRLQRSSKHSHFDQPTDAHFCTTDAPREGAAEVISDKMVVSTGYSTRRGRLSAEENEDSDEDAYEEYRSSRRKQRLYISPREVTGRRSPYREAQKSEETKFDREKLMALAKGEYYVEDLPGWRWQHDALDEVPEQYVAIADYSPDGSDPDMVTLSEGQVVEVLEAKNKSRWLIKTKPSGLLAARQGWVPSSYLEKKTARTTIRSIEEIVDSDGEDLLDARERDALKRRRAIVKELVETEEEFVKDMQHVVNTYFLEMDNPRMPKELRDQKDVLFMNFKSICDFHNNVLIKGVQYYSAEPRKLGKTFLRLERDFDMHANYCRDEPQAQALLATSQVKEYFLEYSRRIGEVDKSLCDHLKLPIQRINDYQLLLKELIKYSARLKEDCIDLQKALDLMLSIPQRANDLKYINCIEGYRGNFHKLGRLLRHEWYTVIDSAGRAKERYLFLFKTHIFATKVHKLSDKKSKFILKDIIRLADVKIQDNPENSCQFELHHTKELPKYPLIFQAKTEIIKEAWLTDIRDSSTSIVSTLLNSADEDQVAVMDKPKVEVLENFDAYEEMNTVMTESIRSGSLTSIDAGDTASLECEILAVPPATVCWLKDNVPLSDSDRIQFVAKDNKRYLVIRHTYPLDSGLYTCHADNELTSSECSAQLTVHTHMEEMKLDDKPSSPVQKAPEFVIKFHNTELLEGTSVRLLLKVRAYPDPIMKFLKNGVAIKEDDRIKIIAEDKETYELVISHVTRGDEGLYTCIAKNSLGEESTSSKIVVTADKQDVFHGIHGVENGVSKKGILQPGEDPKFTWFRDGHDFEASDRFKVMFKDEEDTLALVFQHVKPEDAGLYTCVASTTSGRISCSAELTVEGSVNQLVKEPAKPQIQMHITDTEVSEGGSAMLELKVSGYPRPKVTWSKEGQEIKASGRFRFIYEDEESFALIIKNSIKEDAGTYKIVAKNELGEVTTNGQLLVRAPPKFKKQMHDMSIMTDDPMKFEVEVEGKPAPEIVWYKDGQVVKENERIKMIQEKEEVFALVIKKVIPDDAGSYSCVASNTSGKISEFGNLTVKVPPYFSKELINIDCKEGENIKLDVKVEGNPVPTVKWLKDGSDIKEIGKRITVESDDKSHSVTIKKTEHLDFGVYTCEISSELGTKSTSSNVTVNAAPKLSQRLSDMTVKEGDENVRMEVKAEGFPEPKIRWFIEDMEITETSNKFKMHKAGDLHVLIVKRIDEECAGKYTFKASNDVGEAESSAVLTVFTKPKFLKTLSDIETNEGEDITLNVKVTGNPEPKIKWYKDDEEVHASALIKITKEEENSFTLTVKKVTGDSAGDYECRASNSEGKDVSVSAVVVKTKPQFDGNLKDVEVWLEEEAVFEVRIKGVPEPSVTWYKDGQVLEDGGKVSIVNSDDVHRLILSATRPEDAASYKCRIENIMGEDSQEAKLTVKTSTDTQEPTVLKKLENIITSVGKDIVFETKIYGTPEPEVEWFKDGKLLKESSRTKITFSELKNVYSLEVTNVTSEDEGIYTAKATSINGETSTDAKLDVNVPPSITLIKDKKAFPASTVTVETTIPGKPEPMVKWYFGSNELRSTAKTKINADEASQSYSLVIENIEAEQTGEYSCVATNIAGKAKQQFNITVTTEAPRFIKGLPASSAAKIGCQIKLEVQVYGLPMPQVKWCKDEKEISASFNVKLDQADDRNFSLTIEKLSDGDIGSYTCKAYNKAGEAVSRCQVATKFEAPKFLKSLPREVCIIDGEPFSLEAKLDNNPMPAVKWLKDGKVITPGDRVKITSDPDGRVNLSVESAIPEDRGKYSVVASNEAGEQSSSSQVSVQAVPKQPAFLQKLQATEVTQGTPIKLTAKISGHPKPNVKWLKDGKPLKLEPRVALIQEPDGTVGLQISDAKPEDAGKYTLALSNTLGEASSDADVGIKSPDATPEILFPLKPVNAIEGFPCKLEAKVGGKPLPTIQWLKDGEPLVADGDRIKTVEKPDGSVALVLEKALPEDAGKYSLVATNNNGSAKSDADLGVTERAAAGEAVKAPGFVSPLNDIVVDEGKPAKLFAEVEGNPFPDVEWTKDGEPLKPSDNVSANFDGKTVSLDIKSITPDDSGKYECVLKNPTGEESSAAKVKVNKLSTAPVFIQKITDLTSVAGGEPRFLGMVSGFPKPDVTWYFNDKPLQESEKYKIKRDGDLCALQVRSVKPEDRGKYTCVAKNNDGEVKCSANLEVVEIGDKREKSEPPSFLKKLGDCSVMEGMTAKFTACVTGFPEPDFKWFKDGKEVEASDRIQIQVEPHGLLRFVIKNVKPEDVGSYTLKISNIHGSAESTSKLELEILEERRPRKPTVTPSIEDLDKNISSPVIKDDSDKKKPPSDDADKRPKKSLDDDADRMSRHINGLDEPIIKKPAATENDYDKEVRKPALDDDYERKKRPALDEYVVYEKPRKTGIPFALPDKPIISKMNDRRLTLSWKPSIPDGPSVPVNYIVDMLEVPDGEWFVARSGIRGCCCEIRNLEPFRDYKFRIRVENKYGVSDPSPYAHALRTKLRVTPPKILPHLPPEFDFRPDTSPFFPKDYDIDRPIHDQYAHAPRFLRQQDDTQYGVKNQPASIHWWIYGYPAPNVTFYFNDEKIEMHGRYDSSVSRNASECTLFINRMMDRDVGVYECVAVNDHGEARQRVKLAIAELPVFITHLEEESIMVHKHGKLECRAVGVPYPEIRWYKDWHPIVSSNRIMITWKEPDVCTLTISNAISKDGGLYSCTARNIAGMASTSAMVFTEENEADYAYLTYGKSRVVKARTKPMESFYDIGDELGRGTQSTVYHAVERSTGNSYAAKIMHGKDNARPWMNRELDIMNQLHDRHLVRAVDAFETKNSLTLVTELASGGELLSNICKQSHLTESEVAHYVRQFLWGLDHMHTKGIAHLGLTPSDILISKPGGDDIKICDFGLSSHVSNNKDTFLHYGMPEFVAPEIVNKHPVSLSTDMWSVGVITYLLLSGISPFLGANDAETLQKVQKGHLNFDPEVFSTISDEAKDFISQLLVHDRSGRMDVKAALSHPWLKSADRQGHGSTISTDRLRNYYHRYRDWVGNASCHRFYRRRSLDNAFTHPSRMVYPPGERYTPPSSPETSPSVKGHPPSWDTPKFSDKVNREHENLNYDLGYVDSTSHYQQGPDTYLLQLRDVDFPLRLRQYMRVSAQSSPSMALRLMETMQGKNVTVRERRRFTDVMDEEIDDEFKGETGSVRRRLRSEMSPRSTTKNRLKELRPSRQDGHAPYFREKLQDAAIVEGQPEQLACLVIGDPEPNVTWYRNDVMMPESNRVKIVKDPKGRSILDFQPAKAFDVGVYKVVARNDFGETVCRARMKLADVPGRPDAPEVSEVSNSEALVRWNPPKFDGNSPVVCYSLDYKLCEDVTWKEVANNIDHLFMVVRGLNCGSKYHFRIRAMNRFGWGEHSSPSAETLLVQGAPKIKISRVMKHQQERTEDGKTFDLTARRHSLDYSVEESPISLINALPTDKYRFIAEISRGQFSVIVKCCNHKSGQFYAAKLIEFTPETEDRESVRMEYEILKSLRHERIPSLVEAFRCDNLYVLILEKLQGFSVLTYLTQRHEYNEDLVARIITQVLDALEYLHYRNIVYLNIEPDNVVMTTFSSAQVKLVDFGNAKFLNSHNATKASVNGPVEYLAPEVLQGEDLFPHSDIWGVGVLTYILLSGVSPFLGESEAETVENASFVRYRFEHLHKEITMEATKFLLLTFKRTPTKRPTAEECLDNKWLNPSEYMLKKRERAIFLSSRLRPFAEEYHRKKEELSTTSETLLNAFSGSQISRSVSVEYKSMTTF